LGRTAEVMGMRILRPKLILTGLAAGYIATLVSLSSFAEDAPAAKPADTPEAKPAEQAAPAAPAEKPAEQAATADKAAEKPAEGSDAARPAPAKGPSKWYDGSLQIGADTQWSQGDSDVNLNQTLQLNINPPSYPKLHLRGMLWMHEDLDSDESKSSPLRDINDGYDSDVRARPLYLYAELDDLWGKSVLRIGRQRIQEGVAFNRIDGVYYKQTNGPLDWYVFGGVRASIYRDTHDDAVFGGGASYKFGDKTRLGLDIYYGNEDRAERDEVLPGLLPRLFDWSYPRRIKEDISDDMVAFSIWQEITANIHAYGKFTLHNGESDEYLLDITGFVPSWNVTYDLAYRRRLDTIEDRVTDLAGYYRILGPYDAYDDLMLSVHRPLTEKLVLSLEAERHNSRGDDEYTSNRDYMRYAAILSADKLAGGVNATVSLARWDADLGEGSWIVTGEVSKTFGKVKLSLGADYQQYKDVYEKYNPAPYRLNRLATWVVPGFYTNYRPLVNIFDTGHVATYNDIHTFYTKLKWAVCTDQDLTSQISYEEADGPDSPYWRARVSYEIRF